MRHANKIKKLGRTHSHRKATMAAMSSALIEHKRITTTLPKAKALRTFVEPLINRAKEDTTHNRRQVFRRLQNKHAVTTLFGEIADVLGDRPGGYTRVVKLGQRGGDAAEMAMIELVDFNDVKPEGSSTGKKKTRRSRRKSSGAGAAVAAPAVEEVVAEAEEAAEEVVAEAEEAVEQVAAEVEDVAEEAAAETEEAVEEVAAEVEEATEEVAEEASEEPAAEASEEAEEGDEDKTE